MQSIRGKRAEGVDAANFARQIAGYQHVLIDLGTGDGRFVRHVATTQPGTFAIGVDLCADNLREASRRAPSNALYLVASAYALPIEISGLATHLTVNFPWAELLTGLVAQDMRLPAVLAALCRPRAQLEIRLNVGALATAGWQLHDASRSLERNLRTAGFAVSSPRLLDAHQLRACHTTWAHRLAVGRDPSALYVKGVYVGGTGSYSGP